jgi:hypothetical protein
MEKPVHSTPEESEANQTEQQEHVVDCKGIVHQEFIPPNKMVNQHYYKEVLQHLRQQVC